jgi:hypothetical protein
MGPEGGRKSEYTGNDGHLVWAKDARNLAAALQVFLGTKRPKRVRKSETWFWSAAGKKAIRRFVRFCRKGSFRIH